MQLESREHSKQEALEKQRQQALDKLKDSGTAMKAASSGAACWQPLSTYS